MAYCGFAPRVAAALGCALVLSGCGSGPTTLLVELNGPPTITTVSLALSLSTGAQLTQSLPLNNGKKLPGSILVDLPDEPVQIELDVTGLAGSTQIDTQHASVRSKAHRQVTVPITLGVVIEGDLAGADLTGVEFDFATPPDDLAGADSAGNPVDLLGSVDQQYDFVTPGVDGNVVSPLDLGGGPGVFVLAGSPGGDGHHDDVGQDARFEAVDCLVRIGTKLYMANHWSGRIHTIDLATQQTAPFPLIRAGTGSPTSLDTPSGCAYDGTGNLYVTSYSECTLVKVELATGIVTKILGKPASATDMPIPACGSDDGDASVARFNIPWGIAFDGNGALWISDSADNGGTAALRKVDLAGPSVSTPALTTIGPSDMGAPTTWKSPRGVRFAGGSLYVADDGGVVRIDPNALTGVNIIAKNKLASISDVAVDATYLYAVDSELNSIWRFPLADFASGVRIAGGNIYASIHTDGVGSAARFQSPEWIVLGTNNDVFVSEYYDIRRVTTDTFAVTTFAGLGDHAGASNSPPLLDNPTSLFYDGADNVYISDGGGYLVRKYNLSTATLSTIAGNGNPTHKDGAALSASFYSPAGLALDTNGALYIVEDQNHTLRMLKDGQLTTIVGKPGTSGTPEADGTPGAMSSLASPHGLALDGMGHLFITERGNAVIRQVDLLTGTFDTSVIAGNALNRGYHDDQVGTSAALDAPYDLAYDAVTKTLYFTDISGETVRKVELGKAGHPVSTVSGAPYDRFSSTVMPGDGGSLKGTRHASPSGLAFAPATNKLYVANYDGQSIQVLDLDADVSNTIIGVPLAGFTKPGPLPAHVNGPDGIVVTPVGIIFASYPENTLLVATGLLP